MSDPSQPAPEPGNLRFLRVLVTSLMVVMIGGFLVIVGLFVIRFSSDRAVLPDSITLPDGTKARNFTVGPTWYGVVSENDTILIFDRATGNLRQTVIIEQQ